MRISDLCDYSDLCVAVKGVITVEDTGDADKRKKIQPSRTMLR